MNINELRQLIEMVDQSNITEFKYEYENMKVLMRKQGASSVYSGSAAPAPETEQFTQTAPPSAQVQQMPSSSVDEETFNHLHKIVSPMVGTFYTAPSPDADPFVKVGDHVHSNSVVCIVEAMKLMNEIEAEIDGEIVDVLVERGQLVEYGQPLFLVKTV